MDPPSTCDNSSLEKLDDQTIDAHREGICIESFQKDDPNLKHASSVPWCWADFFKNAGPGLIMMTAFIDPGDLSNDLAVGSEYQFELLWICLWSTVIGYILQMLVAKLAIVTRKSLAEKCKEEYPWFVNVFLWLLMEAALVAVEIQYITGASVGLSLLCGNNGANLPLWASVLVCSTIAYLLLVLEAHGVRLVEVLFVLLISIMCISFAILAGMAKAPGVQVLRGLGEPQLPNEQDAYLLAGGIVGGCISPYNFFLYSSLVINKPLPSTTRGEKSILLKYIGLEAAIVLAFSLFMNVCLVCTFAQSLYQPGAPIISHDSTTPGSPSSPGALVVLQLASPPPLTPDAPYTNYDYMENNPSLNNAGILLGQDWGEAFAYIWALGLLATGLSSTSGAVYAGQVIMEGFVKLKAWNRGQRGLAGSIIAIFHASPHDDLELDVPSDSPSVGEKEDRISTLSTKALVPACIFSPSHNVTRQSRGSKDVIVMGVSAEAAVDQAVHHDALELRIVAESHVASGQTNSCHLQGQDRTRDKQVLVSEDGGVNVMSETETCSHRRNIWLWRVAVRLGLMSHSSGPLRDKERSKEELEPSDTAAAASVAWKRATVSRTIALIPALIVAATYTNPQEILFLNLWLNLLQTLALPFSLLPMLHFTTRSQVMGKYWKNHWFLTLLVAAITALAVFIACYCTIQSTPFPTSSSAVGATWFGWALYLLAAMYFAIGPDHVQRWWLNRRGGSVC